MAANLPKGFYAKTLTKAYPKSSTYKLALYTEVPNLDSYSPSGECKGAGYEAGGMTLTGYKIIATDTSADLAFNTQVDWFNVDVTCKGAIVYEAETGDVLSIKDFGRPCGVLGGIFTVNLNPDGVVGIGEIAA